MAGYLFEWDAQKASSNRQKHGVAFHEATTAFADPLAMLQSDPAHSVDEQRYIVLGMSNRRRLCSNLTSRATVGGSFRGATTSDTVDLRATGNT